MRARQHGLRRPACHLHNMHINTRTDGLHMNNEAVRCAGTQLHCGGAVQKKAPQLQLAKLHLKAAQCIISTVTLSPQPGPTFANMRPAAVIIIAFVGFLKILFIFFNVFFQAKAQYGPELFGLDEAVFSLSPALSLASRLLFRYLFARLAGWDAS